jgi:hypothetical protein
MKEKEKQNTGISLSVGVETEVINPDYLPLLQSIKEKPKYLDMGRTPVQAIELAWQWQDLGFIANNDGYLSITKRGLDYLSARGL